MPELTQAEVSKLLKYEPETGKLFWKERPVSLFNADGYHSPEHNAAMWNTRYAGKEAFPTANSRGYLNGRVFDRTCQAHRVAWLLHYGEWPRNQIDHINGNKVDNRIANLRDIPHSENQKNRPIQKNNKSGFCGVSWHKGRQKWRAQITIGRIPKHLGLFDNYEDAVAARFAANAEHGFSDRHGMV